MLERRKWCVLKRCKRSEVFGRLGLKFGSLFLGVGARDYVFLNVAIALCSLQ